MNKLTLIIAAIFTLTLSNTAHSIGSDGTEAYIQICSYIGSDGTEAPIGSDGTEAPIGSDGTEAPIGSDGTESSFSIIQKTDKIICQIVPKDTKY